MPPQSVTGPHLAAGLVELDDPPEERRLEPFDVRLEAPVDVPGHEVRGVLLGIVVPPGNAPDRSTITVTAGQVTVLNQTITVSNEGGSAASETAGRIDSDKRRPLCQSQFLMPVDSC